MDTAFPFWNADAVLDLTDLRAFARIADLGSVSAAARALKAPKSSVSRSLARLEQAVGAVLVERSTRRLRLTDAGALLRPHARRILNDVDEAETALGGFGGVPRGLLRVNATYAFAQGVLAPMLPPFLARHPEVRVALDIENRRIDPMAEEADLVIRLGPLADSALIARRLAVLEVWLCASPAYLAARGTPARAADLARHDMIMRSDRAERWELRTADGRAEEVEVRPRAVLAEPAAALAAIAGGAGIGRVPDYLASGAIAEGRLVRVLPCAEPHRVEAHALYPSHRSLSAKVRVFIDALVAHLAAARSGLAGLSDQGRDGGDRSVERQGLIANE